MTKTSLPNLHSTGARPALSVQLPVDRRVRAWAILADRFEADDEEGAPAELARVLTRLGVAFTRLRDDADDPSESDRVREAADTLANAYGRRGLFVGHGAAASALLEIALTRTDVLAVATIGAPADPAITARMGSLRRPFLVMHAPLDNVVGVQHALRLLEPAHHPKSFISLDTADHGLSSPVDVRYAASVLGSWVERFLPEREAPRHHAVARIGRDRFRTEMVAGGHAIIADEPATEGGTDLGPTPFELLLAALGGCTAITIRMYADRKGWPLDGVHVELAHHRVPPDESGCEGGGPGKVDVIETTVRLEGDLDDAQQARLMDIAEKCPVHKVLKIPPCLRTTAVGSDADRSDGVHA